MKLINWVVVISGIVVILASLLQFDTESTPFFIFEMAGLFIVMAGVFYRHLSSVATKAFHKK